MEESDEIIVPLTPSPRVSFDLGEGVGERDSPLDKDQCQQQPESSRISIVYDNLLGDSNPEDIKLVIELQEITEQSNEEDSKTNSQKDSIFAPNALNLSASNLKFIKCEDIEIDRICPEEIQRESKIHSLDIESDLQKLEEGLPPIISDDYPNLVYPCDPEKPWMWVPDIIEDDGVENRLSLQFIKSIKEKDATQIEELLKHSLNLQMKDEEGFTALIRAISIKHGQLTRFILSQQVELDECNDDGFGALHFACLNCDITLVKILLNHPKSKCNPNKKARCNGNTPLHFAVVADNGKQEEIGLEIVKMLVENGAQVQVSNTENKTPLDFAKHLNNEKIVEYLKSAIIEERKRMLAYQSKYRGYEEYGYYNRHKRSPLASRFWMEPRNSAKKTIVYNRKTRQYETVNIPPDDIHPSYAQYIHNRGVQNPWQDMGFEENPIQDEDYISVPVDEDEDGGWGNLANENHRRVHEDIDPDEDDYNSDEDDFWGYRRQKKYERMHSRQERTSLFRSDDEIDLDDMEDDLNWNKDWESPWIQDEMPKFREDWFDHSQHSNDSYERREVKNIVIRHPPKKELMFCRMCGQESYDKETTMCLNCKHTYVPGDECPWCMDGRININGDCECGFQLYGEDDVVLEDNAEDEEGEEDDYVFPETPTRSPIRNTEGSTEIVKCQCCGNELSEGEEWCEVCGFTTRERCVQCGYLIVYDEKDTNDWCDSCGAHLFN